MGSIFLCCSTTRPSRGKKFAYQTTPPQTVVNQTRKPSAGDASATLRAYPAPTLGPDGGVPHSSIVPGAGSWAQIFLRWRTLWWVVSPCHWPDPKATPSRCAQHAFPGDAVPSAWPQTGTVRSWGSHVPTHSLTDRITHHITGKPQKVWGHHQCHCSFQCLSSVYAHNPKKDAKSQIPIPIPCKKNITLLNANPNETPACTHSTHQKSERKEKKKKDDNGSKNRCQRPKLISAQSQ